MKKILILLLFTINAAAQNDCHYDEVKNLTLKAGTEIGNGCGVGPKMELRVNSINFKGHTLTLNNANVYFVRLRNFKARLTLESAIKGGFLRIKCTTDTIGRMIKCKKTPRDAGGNPFKN